MNSEKLKELVSRATGFQTPAASNMANWECIETLVELIVKECLAQVDKVDAMLDDDKEKTGAAWVGLAIAKHFGIE